MVHAKDMTNLMNDTAQLVDAIAPTSGRCDHGTPSRVFFLMTCCPPQSNPGLLQVHDDMTKKNKKES